MQETLITFETAKLAKENGFSVDSTDNYFSWEKRIGNVPLGLVHEENNKLTLKEMKKFKNNLFPQILYQRPSQSILQKWLRDKFFIQIDVVAYYDEEQLPLHKDNIQKPKGYFFWNYYDEDFSESKAIKFETYEEALELGLQESLKLIKTNESRED